MSTIASPRHPSHSNFTSSARQSLDLSRSSAVSSPINLSNPRDVPPTPPNPNPSSSKRSNRVALREYYNLRAPRIELPESEVPASDIDAPDFDADEYVKKITEQMGMQELLKLYTKIVGEMRALDAEKKALVYDNYNKLIAATETIRKMRTTMDPLTPMASTLDPAITQIYNQASSIRETLRESIPHPDSEEGKKRETERQRRRTKELATEVLGVPERLRALTRDGKLDEARKQWQMPRRLLQVWKEKGVGGEHVQNCLDEGDGILKGGMSDDDESGSSARASKDGR